MACLRTCCSQRRGSRSFHKSNCSPRPSVSHSSREPICLVVPGARMASTALARCTSRKNSRWQCATSNGWQFPVAKCSFFDCQWQMLSDTFREESQRKQCLRTKARSDSDTSCGVVVRKAAETGMLFPRFSPDAIYCSNETGEELLSISSANSESKTHSMLQSSEEEPGKKMSTLLITP